MGDLAKGIKSFKKGMSSDDSNQTKIQSSEEEKSTEEKKIQILKTIN
jgi:Sec-independent protein translocase protein TatA